MADIVSYMLKGELCEILDWNQEHIDRKDSLNHNFVRIKLQHDGYEWHVLSWQLHTYSIASDTSSDNDILPMDKNSLLLASYEYMWSPYLRWGRMQSGVDCSWLSQLIYAKFGISLLRDAREQITQWQEVMYPDLQVGDLLFFEEVAGSGKVKHVWIFLEPWKILHASEQWPANVRIDSLDERWIIDYQWQVANIYVWARRYI